MNYFQQLFKNGDERERDKVKQKDKGINKYAYISTLHYLTFKRLRLLIL